MPVTTNYAYPPLLMSAREAARYINISPRALDELQARGEIIPVGKGQRRSFHRTELEDWARRQPEWKTPRDESL